MSKVFFDEQYERFKPKVLKAVQISEALGGRSETQRNAWVSYLHARLCANCLSVRQLLDFATEAEPGRQQLDHFSIASIGRTAIEVAIMILYMSDPLISEDQWNLRKAVIDLHDATNRYRMFKPVKERDPKAKEMVDEYRSVATALKDIIKANPEFKTLSAEQRERLLTGQDFYVGGIRPAVRAAGWEVSEYDFISSYLSAFIHCAPVSFYRAVEHAVDFQKISEFQYGLCGVVLDHMRGLLEAVIERLELVFPEHLHDGAC